MSDMRKAIVPKSDQLNTDDLISGARTIVVTKVAIKDSAEQPVSIFFDGDNGKPYKPCKSMSRVLVEVWGPDANKYIGRSMTLYRDPEVTWAGMKVGGIRISHVSELKEAKTLALTATKQTRKPFTVKPLSTTSAPSKPADTAIKKAGDEVAALGVAEYTAWLGKLSPEAKESARAFSKEWTAIAREVDRVKSEPMTKTDENGFPIDTGQGDPE